MTYAKDTHQTAAEKRTAIRECLQCDEAGWLLGTDRLVLDPAIRCEHGLRSNLQAIRHSQERLK